MPKRAFASQRFVHMVYESPIHCSKCANYNDDVFNYSATYTPDSDYSSIYWTDSGLYWELNEQFDDNFDHFTQKKKMAAALISNYILGITSNRVNFIITLNKTLPVDLYGVGKLLCPSNCMQYIADNYKFFLAFENSFCRNYISEKFFDWFNFDVIPVVMGLGNYSYYIPKSAYINVLDFSSVDKLIDYLNYVGANKTAYNEYFKWKRFIKSDFFTRRVGNGFLCEMCIQLHLEEFTGRVKQKRLTDIRRQYGMKENCVKGELTILKELEFRTLNDSDQSFYMSDEKWT
jgi:hypothetical protein